MPRTQTAAKTDSAETDSVKTIVRGACPHDCPDTCAMLVTVEDGRAIEVRGDPEHPFTRGALCVKVNDYVERVYSPDRVLHPLRRVGPKGSSKFERIGWDAALHEIASRFKAIIAEHGPQAILPYSYLGTEGLLNGLNVGDAFFNRLGASISRAHLLRLRRYHRLYDDGRPDSGHRPREFDPLPLHHHLGLQRNQHQPSSMADLSRRPGAAARRWW